MVSSAASDTGCRAPRAPAASAAVPPRREQRPSARAGPGSPRNHDVEHHREQQGVPRHRDGGEAEEQAPRWARRPTIIRASLSATWVRVKFGSPSLRLSPDEHHRGAGRGGEQDEPGDVAVDLGGRQARREDVADEDPAEQRHRERLHRPVDEQGDAESPASVPAPRRARRNRPCSSIGTIMSQTSTPTGRLMCAICIAPSAGKACGNRQPRA